MSVYVNDLIRWPGKPKPGAEQYFGNGRPSCHMTADNLDELHAMALLIGLRRQWFQEHKNPSLCHYDLTPGKRALALQCGAIPGHAALTEIRDATTAE